ncbi:MAG: phosphate ABC transporter permease PstA [Phycisphaerae bacterium]
MSHDSSIYRARPYNQSARIVNLAIIGFCYVSAALALSALFYIFGYILYRGCTAINWDFFTQLPKPSDDLHGGMSNCITGTLVLIAMASCVGIPVGMLCGIYLSEYARAGWFSNSVRLVVDILAGVPSIIVGLLGYELVVVPAGAYSAWAGAVALGFMMCPIIARTTEEILKLVPQAYREASIGVGASRFQTLAFVILPAARGGIITGIMLAVARVAGETAPLLFTVLGSDQKVIIWRVAKIWGLAVPYFSVDTNQAFPSLTVQIFKYAQSAEREWIRQAWAGMLVLIVIVTVLNLAVRFVSRDRMRRG